MTDLASSLRSGASRKGCNEGGRASVTKSSKDEFREDGR